MQSKTSIRLWLLGSVLGFGAVLFGIVSFLTDGNSTASASATNAALTPTSQTTMTTTAVKKAVAPTPSTRTRTS
jgi:hypothetical protein